MVLLKMKSEKSIMKCSNGMKESFLLLFRRSIFFIFSFFISFLITVLFIRYRKDLANDVNQFLDDMRRIMGVQMVCLGFYPKIKDDDEMMMKKCYVFPSELFSL